MCAFVYRLIGTSSHDAVVGLRELKRSASTVQYGAVVLGTGRPSLALKAVSMS